MRVLLLPLMFLSGVMMASGLASAADAHFEIHSPDHPSGHTMTVSRVDGKLTVPLFITMTAGNFTCLQPTQVDVPITENTYPKYYAAPLNPYPVSGTFTIGVNEPGAAGPAKGYKGKDFQLEVDWYEDEVPDKNAQFTYHLSTDRPTIANNGAACPGIPDPSAWGKASFDITIRMDDKVADNQTNKACQDIGACETTQATTDGGNSPGFDAFVLVGAIVGGVALLKRRKA